jgi:hypothetical protein
MTDLPTHYLTRDQLHQLLVQHGFPLGRSTLDKLCAPAVNQGPPVEAMWPAGRGRNQYRPLYDAQIALDWAKSLLKAPTVTNNL